MNRWSSLLAGFFSLAATCTLNGQNKEPTPRFESQVLPILEVSCLSCHDENAGQAGLVLTSRDNLLNGGDSGPAVIPGSSSQSLLFQKISSGAMPMNRAPLDAADIRLIRNWIDSGAPTQGEIGDEGSRRPRVTEREVLANILHLKCIVCHGKHKQEGGLDLRTRASLLKGGNSGPAMVLGRPGESLLIQRISDRDMPPPKLQFAYFVRDVTLDELDKLRQWIADGAPPDLPSEVKAGIGVSEKDREFWSFKAPQRPQVPRAQDQQRVRSPIDAFLLQKLESKGLAFSPETDRLTLMRRAYFDLTGLPPTPEEVEAYLEDTNLDAYERLINRLLDSPRYGERWGQYWLNAAGYADSEGGPADDLPRPHAYRYRDYVIRAFNQDKPYDQFLLEQIAGDELFDYRAANPLTPQQKDYLVATGFLRMTPDATNSHDVNFVPYRLDTVARVVEMLGSTVLGLTVGCARCHDHKFDPLSQRDYYRFSAILRSAYDPYDWLLPNRLTGTFFEEEPYEPKRYLESGEDELLRQVRAHNAPIQAEIRRLDEELEATAQPLRKILLEETLSQIPEKVRADVQKALATAPRKRSSLDRYLLEQFPLSIKAADLRKRFPEFAQAKDKWKKAMAAKLEELKAEPGIRALFDMGGEPTPTYLLKRGEPFNPGPQVQPGIPSVLQDGLEPYRVAKPSWSTDTSGRRLALARWLVQPDHPLTARVLVNRIWQNHFKKGLVTTPGNFGKLGTSPSHPRLLDWLATEFVEQGWRIKSLHRLIMTSSAYRQSSRQPALGGHDPDNLLLSRFPFRRLDAEAIRDSVLAVAGRLDANPFGPPQEVKVTQEGEVLSEPTESGYRRSIYMLQRRGTPLTLLQAFDLPRLDDARPNCLMREHSTVSTQALQLLNSDLLRESARYFAGRVMDAVGGDLENQVERVYLSALSRRPREEERKLGIETLQKLGQAWRDHLEQEVPAEPKEMKARWLALGTYCHTILNSPEFVYID